MREFRILGPLEVVDDDRLVPVPGGKPRALLAALLLRAGRTVPVDVLIDELWPERPPDTAANTLQVYVSQLRKALGGDVVVRRGSGYAVDVAPEAVDALAFERLVAEARALPAAESAERLRAALELWRGEPEADAARLEALRLAAVEERLVGELELGRHADVLPELTALVEREPLRERPRALLMTALYRSGRQADALAEFARAREALVEELGVEPGPELQRLQRAILEHDASVAAPVRAAPASRLPAPPTPLVGRERELAEAAALLRASRLVTLTGPGGIGKTRVALELARRLEPDFADGAVLVRLAAIDDAAVVLRAIARALDLPEAQEDELRTFLRPRSLLVVLDNFEQLLGAAQTVASLLEDAPAVRMIVTSRAVLRIAAEQEYAVPPLDEARDLFVARARAVDAAFEPDDAVAEICARLERIPLAIELAAARTKLLPPAAILERLTSRLDLLTGGFADAAPHQQTMRAAIDWSYRLLEPGEQRLFARLSVFVGGASLRAIEAVCGGSFDDLASLVDKSLLRRDGDRFAMLEVLREFAGEQLEDADAVRAAHLAFFLDHAERAADAVDIATQPEIFDDLEREHGNLRAALAFALDARDADSAARLAAALARFWQIHAHLVEAARAYEAVLALEGAPLRARQKAWNALGIMRGEQGDFGGAEAAFNEALTLAQELGDGVRTAIAYSNLGNLTLFRGDSDEARRLFSAALELYDDAQQPRGRAITTQNLGIVAFCEGRLEEAEEVMAQALAIAEEIGDQREVGASRRTLARTRLERGDRAAARETLALSIPPARAVGDRHGLADAVEIAGAVAAADGRTEDAASLFGAADALRDEIAATRQPDVAEWYARTRGAVEDALGAGAFATAYDSGRRLSLEDALALGLDKDS